jgi:hypothetical protein
MVQAMMEGHAALVGSPTMKCLKEKGKRTALNPNCFSLHTIVGKSCDRLS